MIYLVGNRAKVSKKQGFELLQVKAMPQDCFSKVWHLPVCKETKRGGRPKLHGDCQNDNSLKCHSIEFII